MLSPLRAVALIRTSSFRTIAPVRTMATTVVETATTPTAPPRLVLRPPVSSSGNNVSATAPTPKFTAYMSSIRGELPLFPYADALQKGPLSRGPSRGTGQWGTETLPSNGSRRGHLASSLMTPRLGTMITSLFSSRTGQYIEQQLIMSFTYSHRLGMYDAYGIQHEQFVWDIRTEPGVVNSFATLWGTEKLVSSFDGVTVMPQAKGAGGCSAKRVPVTC
jgi:hypothetical protein